MTRARDAKAVLVGPWYCHLRHHWTRADHSLRSLVDRVMTGDSVIDSAVLFDVGVSLSWLQECALRKVDERRRNPWLVGDLSFVFLRMGQEMRARVD